MGQHLLDLLEGQYPAVECYAQGVIASRHSQEEVARLEPKEVGDVAELLSTVHHPNSDGVGRFQPTQAPFDREAHPEVVDRRSVEPIAQG